MTERDRTFAKFLIVGCINTLVGLGSIYLFKWGFGLGDYVANGGGYAVGLSVSYLLNSAWTFSVGTGNTMQVFRFLGAFAVAYSANFIVLFFQLNYLGINAYLAQAFSLAVYTVFFFLMCRLFVFRLRAIPEQA